MSNRVADIHELREPPTAKLSPTCLRILVAILRLKQERGYPPSIREIAGACGWTATNHVWCVLRKLRAAGLVEFSGFRGRTVVPRCRVEVWEEGR